MGIPQSTLLKVHRKIHTYFQMTTNKKLNLLNIADV